MENLFIERVEEIAILEDALASREAEMVSVIGRRRVGKTYLINTIYKNRIDFEIIGLQNAPRSEQLQNFAYQLTRVTQFTIPIKTPNNWLEAFTFLIRFLEEMDYTILRHHQKKIHYTTL